MCCVTSDSIHCSCSGPRARRTSARRCPARGTRVAVPSRTPVWQPESRAEIESQIGSAVPISFTLARLDTPFKSYCEKRTILEVCKCIKESV
jgi:hypothetical protein